MWLKTLMMMAALVLVEGRAECKPTDLPMDLQDSRARWVSVRFERSPAESPGRLNAEYSQTLLAWFEPGPRGERARVIIDGDVVERTLFRDEAPVANSFSDFVWEFNIETGHVISARVSGAVARPVRWGLLSMTTRVRVHVEMSTARVAGYRRASKRFGNTLYRLCREPDSESCTLVEPSEFDRRTGYVNAVGGLQADSLLWRVRTFSPLGEAIFTELSEEAALAVEKPKLVQRGGSS